MSICVQHAKQTWEPNEKSACSTRELGDGYPTPTSISLEKRIHKNASRMKILGTSNFEYASLGKSCELDLHYRRESLLLVVYTPSHC